MSTVFAVIAGLFYAGGTILLLRSGRARLTLAAALLLHSCAVVTQVVHADVLRIGAAEAWSLVALQTALVLWIVSLRQQLAALGVVVYPIAGLSAVCGALITVPTGNDIPLSDWPVGLHILLSLASAGFLTLASIQAVGLAFLHNVLHERGNFAAAQHLPPMETLERLLFQMIFAGFSLLTLTLLSGLLFIHNLFAQHLAQKTVLSICAWCIFAVLLWGRQQYGWRGKTAVRWALTGYATLVLAYFGSKLLVEQILRTHWS